MKTPISLLAASLLLAGACGGDDGGDAAVVSAFPAEGFVGRTTSVIIVGEDTAFTDASTVDFGEGVTVNSVMAVGNTGLVVEITAALDAPAGPRTVTVDGLSLADGFTLAQPIEVAVRGTPAQGSFSLIEVTNLDLLNPFDLTTDDTGAFVRLAASVDNEGEASILNASGTSLLIQLSLDVNAAPGETIIDIVSGAEGAVSRTSVDVQARDPIALTAGTVTDSLANGFDSVLYSFTTGSEALTALSIQPPNTEAGTAFVQLLGPSGSFSEPIGFAAFSIFGPIAFSNHLPAGQTVYAVFFDGQAETPLDYSIDVATLTVSDTVDEAEPNDAFDEGVQAVTLPGGVTKASFEGEADQDWFSVTIGPDDVGKILNVSSGGFSQADPVLTIMDTDGETPLAGPEDNAFFDSLSAPLEAEGTYFVQITSSDFGPTVPDNSDYSLIITLEDPPAPPPE